MLHSFDGKIALSLLLSVCLLVMVIVCGCSTEYYKEDADEEVYNIIESKWQQDFGNQSNYRVGDVEPGPDDLQIEAPESISEPIKLAQAVSIATAKNRGYQTQKENLYLTALDLTLERHQFARQWFGTIDAEYLRNVPGTGKSNDEQLSYSNELGFDQLLADGAAISAGIALDWAQFLTGDPHTTLGSVLVANITQPLLRGSGRKIVQENLTQAERDALYQIRSFNRFRKEFVVSIVTDYYRVLQRRDAVTNAENNFKRRGESRERLEMEAKAGRRNRFEVDQAEQDWLRAKDNYVQTQQRYEQLLDEFKIRLAVSTDADIELDQKELTALKQLEITEPDYALSAAIETALLGRLDLANSIDRIDDAARKAMVAADSLGAELNLIGSANVDSTEKTDFTRLQFHKGSYSFGLEADLPLDRKAERNAYREALIVIEQRQRAYENDKDEIMLQVRQAYRELREAAERYGIQSNSLELAQRRVESTNLLLEAGRATTRDLLESQDALFAAENNLTAALVDHAVAKLNFFRDVGVLQAKPDGMWKL